MKQAFKLLNNKITFLVLDYNRPDNLKSCLSAIRDRCKIKHEIITLINGGQIDYAIELFKEGKTDKLLLSNTNEGSSLGILRLVESCTTDWFIFLQSDNIFNLTITEDILSILIKIASDYDICGIDFTGLVPRDSLFSERAFLMRKDFYLAHDLNTGYGTGPFYNPAFPNSEQTTLQWIQLNNKHMAPCYPPIVIDSGKYAILELPCGGVLKRRSDTHQVWVLKKPLKKVNCYGLSEEEWDIILKGQWIGGTIPKNCEKSKFFFYSSELDPIENL